MFERKLLKESNIHRPNIDKSTSNFIVKKSLFCHVELGVLEKKQFESLTGTGLKAKGE